MDLPPPEDLSSLELLPSELFWQILQQISLSDVCTLIQASRTLRYRCSHWPLRHLDISAEAARISTPFFTHLATRWGTSLHTLTLTLCSISDDDLAAIASAAPGLQKIYAGKTAIADTGLIALAHACNNLRVVSVPFTNVGNSGVFAVANNCPQLELLSLRECHNVTTPSITAIASKCRDLRTLFLDGCGITNGALVAVAAFCPVLHALSVSGVKSISDQGIVRIAMACTSLVMLDVFGTGITDSSLLAIATGCPTVRYLNLGMCVNATLRGVEEIGRRCTSLVDLDIAAIVSSTDATVQAIIRSNPGLERLNLSRCSNLTGESVRPLGKLNLDLLRLRGCRAVLPADIRLAIGEKLKTLDLSMCDVDDDVLSLIAVRCQSRLKRVYVDFTRVTERGVRTLVTATSRTLEHLSVVGTSVPAHVVAELSTAALTIIGPDGDELDLPYI